MGLKRTVPKGPAGALAGAIAVVLLACHDPDTGGGAGGGAGATTIGAHCDQLLPVFCTYAVETCGASGAVADCVANARPVCCQGACSRPATIVKDLLTCEQAYVAQGCSEVLAGLTPEACREVVELQ